MTPTSTALVLDQVYTRQDLIERFGIRVVVSAALRPSEYGQWHGNQLSVPANGSPAPAKEALRAHFEAAVASRDVA